MTPLPPPLDGRTPPEDAPAIRLAAALLIAILLTPLVVAPGVLHPYVLPRAVYFRALVELALLVLTFLILTRRSVFRGPDPFLWIVGAYLGVNCLAAATGLSPLRSVFGDFERMWGLFTWFHFALFYLLLRATLDTHGWTRFLRAAVGVAVLVSVFGLLEAASLGWHGRISSTIGNPGFVAAYLIFTLAISGALLAEERRRGVRLVLIAALALQLLALLQTRGRAALLALAVAALWAAGLRLRAASGRNRALPAAGGAAVIAVGAGILLAPDLPVWERVPGLDRLASGIDDAARFGPWADALRAFARRPLLGYGMENSYHAHSANFSPELYRLPEMRAVLFDRVHNAYLEALIGAGVLGLLAFLGLWAALLLTLFRARGAGRFGEGEFLALSSAVIGYLVYLAFWFEDWSSFPLVFVLAAWVSTRASGGPLLRFGERRNRSRSSTALLMGLAMLTVALVLYRHAVIPIRVAAQAADALRAPSPTERLQRLARALEFRAVGGSTILFQLVEELGTLEPRLALLRRDPEAAAALDGALQAGLQAASAEIARDPRNDLLYAQRALLLRAALIVHARPEIYRAAVEDGERAISLGPGRIPYREQLARLHLLVGRREDAVRVLQRALEVYGDLDSTHYLLARVHLRAGDPVSAAERAVRALATPSPSRNAELVVQIGSALEAAGRAPEAIRLYRAYLDAWRLAWEPAVAQEAAPSPLVGGDLRVAARLPVVLLRSGDPAAALAAARAFADRQPAARRVAESFGRDLERGRSDLWLRLGHLPVALARR